MVCRGDIRRMVFYLRLCEFRIRYKTYNPMLIIIKKIPKAKRPLPRLATLERIDNARPPRKQIPGKLLVKALNLKLIIDHLLIVLAGVYHAGHYENKCLIGV